MMTCGLKACTSGSSLNPTLSNECGKPLPLPFSVIGRLICGGKAGPYSLTSTGYCKVHDLQYLLIMHISHLPSYYHMYNIQQCIIIVGTR